MYTVSKGPSKIVAKSRRGLTQNYEKFETIKESGKRTAEYNSAKNNAVPRPVFQQIKKSATQQKPIEEEALTPQHEEIIKYINDSWNIIVAHNPYDSNNTCKMNGKADSNNNNAATTISSSTTVVSTTTSTLQNGGSSSMYCIEPPSPVLSDFKPFDLESWWGRRLFNNITKSL